MELGIGFGMLLLLLIGIVLTIVFWVVIIRVLAWALGDTGCIVVVVIIGGPIIGFAAYMLYKYLGY
ncbi:hypothetical protein CD144_01950 [Staphylococcus equorum subsp. linens]|uniref:hypothetical protein n=1 Tax=Staphylococcus equorum TaxID=246432 RepID=UPI000CD1B4D4|nr:hypothetical protein [Staphylococcus equorum]MDK9857651.1 hypothetical protein [Staphylococcus equorum]MDK9874712.1 hypothetical protein [Staphylococcus equorum]PNZ09015.1 hypothetical protein CD144_01950 [Staphylococcus equorum subsp. linens]QQT16814.1 hypothetical protein I6J07_07815 [Staphylococcus equorum]